MIFLFIVANMKSYQDKKISVVCFFLKKKAFDRLESMFHKMLLKTEKIKWLLKI